ncbi:MAG TPA: helix-turn-helix transcriptional regulator [Streptosporangiaceae bacterium]|nr:helix-turn-helix transcriptional regulator [Streptosporangiaceae bacterium]
MHEPPVIGPRDREQQSRPLLRTIIGQVLRRTRLEQGRTISDVARTARVSMPYLSELERGRKEASSEVLAAICDALRIELSDLLARVENVLVDDRLSRARIIRLDSIQTRISPQGRGSGEARCMLAA